MNIHDNFFALGGHSLLATRVMSRLRQTFQIELPLRRLFEHPTIAQFAQAIEQAAQTRSGLELTPIQPLSRDGELPLSFAQERLWFLTQLEPGNPFYNAPGAVHLSGRLNLPALAQSFNEVLRRHEVLRTFFREVEGKPIGVPSGLATLSLPMIDLSELPVPEREAEVRKLVLSEAQQSFDLTRDLLLRIKLLRLGQQEHVLIFNMHYLASDAWSAGVLLEEISTLYPAYCAQGDRHPCRNYRIQYAGLCGLATAVAPGRELRCSQLAYWRQQLEGAPTALELPTDYPRPAVQPIGGRLSLFRSLKRRHPPSKP